MFQSARGTARATPDAGAVLARRQSVTGLGVRQQAGARRRGPLSSD